MFTIDGELNFLYNFFDVKQDRKSIFLPSNLIMNNTYCENLVKGLIDNSNVDVPWERVEEKTSFISEELRDDFIGCLETFFSKKWEDEEPEVDGKLAEFATENFSLVSKNIAVKTDRNVSPAVPTFYYASATSYPLQFTMKSENLIFDMDENSFIIKDFIWFCIKPGGFILSLSEDEFKFFDLLMKQILRSKGNNVRDFANDLFKPSAQERIYKNWGIFYMFLKETGLLHSSYLKL